MRYQRCLPTAFGFLGVPLVHTKRKLEQKEIGIKKGVLVSLKFFVGLVIDILLMLSIVGSLYLYYTDMMDSFFVWLFILGSIFSRMVFMNLINDEE
ncbi:hypothetical protein [Salinicoccus albus]|uniref:hypothetical protein n=1 Tax=Salinicoccus albus TaxID=418756 RepID=UPI0012EA4AD2|nr:hypothetical protein [Salinicoccus albus]